jgi:TRAP-type C4-dicarboxylate transport system permease small subunit
MRFKNFFENFCGLLLFFAVTISFAEIVARVAFKTSIDLFFDFSVWITVWACLLIGGLLVSGGGHISIDFMRKQLHGRVRQVLEVILGLITLAYVTLITVGSIIFIQQLYQRQSIFPRYFPIHKWIVELCVPIGMFVFTVYAFVEIVKSIKKKW